MLSQQHGKLEVLAEALYSSFCEAGLTVWLDIKMKNLNAHTMEGVKNCWCVVAVLTGGDGCANVSTCKCVTSPTDWPSKCTAYFNRSFCVLRVPMGV